MYCAGFFYGFPHVTSTLDRLAVVAAGFFSCQDPIGPEARATGPTRRRVWLGGETRRLALELIRRAEMWRQLYGLVM
jgi:hypothetical protein